MARIIKSVEKRFDGRPDAKVGWKGFASGLEKKRGLKMDRRFWWLLFCVLMAILSAVLLYRVAKN